jgi:hypothetical protein
MFLTVPFLPANKLCVFEQLVCACVCVCGLRTAARGFGAQEDQAAEEAMKRILDDKAMTETDKANVASLQTFRVPVDEETGEEPEALTAKNVFYHADLQGSPLIVSFFLLCVWEGGFLSPETPQILGRS